MTLASFFETLFGVRKAQTEDRPQVLNKAMSAYVSTFPREEKLRAHLEKTRRVGQMAEIEATLRQALKAVEEHLYAQEGGVRWTSDFETEMYERIKTTSPWLDRNGFHSLASFGQWLCWHEGLNATEPGD